ncbi:Uncharacterised protein [Klebsiella pneumoniae]|nr:Uncharacterised protein [Klebsiella pneumoniae]
MCVTIQPNPPGPDITSGLNKTVNYPAYHLTSPENPFDGAGYCTFNFREVFQYLAAQPVERASKAISEAGAYFIPRHASHKAEGAQRGHEFIGADGGHIGVIADRLRHRGVFATKLADTATHCHQGVFIQPQHLSVLVRAVIRHTAKTLADAGKDRRHIPHVAAGITRLNPQPVEETLSAGIVTHEPGKIFERAAGPVDTAANLTNCIPYLLNTLYRRACALRGPVQVIETAGDFRGKGHHRRSGQLYFGAELDRLECRAGNDGIKFSGAGVINFEPKRDQKVLERFSVH